MIRLSRSEIEARAKHRPVGYVEDVLHSAARIDGDVVELEPEAFSKLCLKYRGRVLPRHGPKLAELLTDYHAALKPWRDSGLVPVDVEDFVERLEACRRCPRGFWTENYADGWGRCMDVRRSCDRIRLWDRDTRCLLEAW